MTEPLRIEMVVPSMDTGGMEVMVADLARALNSRGHVTGITCLEGEGELAPGLKAEGIPVTLSPAPGIGPLLIPGALSRWLKRRQPDVVHIHSGVWLKAVTAARAARVPRVVYTAHGLLDRTPWSLRLMMRLAARSTDQCIAVSEPLRQFLISQVGVAADKVVTVANGIDTERFSPALRSVGLRSALGCAPDALLVGVVARLVAGKNHRLLLKAFAALAPRFNAAHLIIVGDGPLREALQDQARQYGVRDRVHFLGSAADTAPLYREFDLFVLPSLAEGTSISILEAMASGLAVLATDVGGNPALLADGAGRLVPTDDLEAMTTAMATLLEHPGDRSRLGNAARLRVVQRYSLATMVDRYLLAYRNGATLGPVPASAGGH